MKFFSWQYRLSVVFTAFLLLSFGAISTEFVLPLFGLSKKETITLKPLPFIPVANSSLKQNPEEFSSVASISAQASYVYEIESGTELWALNPDQLFHPASLTKLMTALVIKELLPLEQEITIMESDIVLSNKIGLEIGERLTVQSLLQAMLIASSNEATEALARSYPNGSAGLVADMNKKATQLSLKQTVFTNPVGYDHPKHLSTARELNILAREIWQDEFLRSIIGQTELSIQDTSRKHTHALVNTNQLLTKDSRIKGMKTGTTQAAKEVFLAVYQAQDHTIIISILGSEDRFKDTEKILSWLENKFVWYRPESLLFGLN